MTKNVERILKALRANAGTLTISEVWASVSNNVPKAELDGYLQGELAALVEPIRFRKMKRLAWCWRLTSAGWAVSNQQAADSAPMVLSREAVVQQVNRLAREGDSWATELLDSKVLAEAVKAEVPTQRDVVNLLWRMFETKQRPARLFSVRFLKLMGEGDKVKQVLEREKAEVKSRKRKSGRKLDEAAVERINRARERIGMDRIQPSVKSSPKASTRQPSAPLAHDVTPKAPRPMIAPNPPQTPRLEATRVSTRRVFRFPSGAIFESARLGGGRVYPIQRGGKFFDDAGTELLVIGCKVAPGVGWELDEFSGNWHRKGDQPAPIQPEPFAVPFNAPAEPALLPNLCRHKRGQPNSGVCYGHCSSPNYQPL